MPEAIIKYFDLPSKVGCDGNCKKAWGINNRPRVQLSDDEDDYYYLADGELDDAPDDPGTYEGGFAKPPDASHFPNKWCVRECERCEMSRPGEESEQLLIPNLTVRLYNQPTKHQPITAQT